jgi:hypothetical protein
MALAVHNAWHALVDVLRPLVMVICHAQLAFVFRVVASPRTDKAG